MKTLILSATFCRRAATLLAGLALAGAAQAQTYTPVTLDFNDLPPATGGNHPPAGYGGFNYAAQWYYMTDTRVPGQNFLAMGSPGGGTTIRRANGGPFYFDGAMFWSRRGLDANGSFAYVLYYKGKTVFDGTKSSKTRMRFTGTPTLITTGYKGLVDGVALAFRNDDYDHIAADDFRFRVPAAP